MKISFDDKFRLLSMMFTPHNHIILTRARINSPKNSRNNRKKGHKLVQIVDTAVIYSKIVSKSSKIVLIMD